MNAPRTPVTVAQIGCGYWGPNLLRNLNALDEFDVVRVVDASEDRRRFVQSNYPKIAVGAEAEEVLESDVQAVIVSTPAASKTPIAPPK